MFDFTGKTAVITGGSRGIGRAVAENFASNGANVAFIYGSSKGKADELEAEFAEKGVKVKGYCADVSDMELSLIHI